MSDLLTRVAENMIARTEGPLHLRFFLQPLVAMTFAVLDGRKDARAGATPYFWALLTDEGNRAEVIRSGWRSVGKVFLIALALDMIYQRLIQRFVYPGEAIITAFLLAIIPYVLLRGVVTRLYTALRLSL